MRPSKYARIISYLYPKHFEKLLRPTILGFLVHLKNHNNSVICKYTRLDAGCYDPVKVSEITLLVTSLPRLVVRTHSEKNNQ